MKLFIKMKSGEKFVILLEVWVICYLVIVILEENILKVVKNVVEKGNLFIKK